MTDQHDDVRVSMPLTISSAMLEAVKRDPLTACDDLETWYARLGWLICAYEVLVRAASEGNRRG